MAPKWMPIKTCSQMAVEGGYLKTACKIEVKEVDTQQGVDMFAKIDKKQERLMHAAAGRGAREGSLSRTKLIETIRDTLIRTAGGWGRGGQQPFP